MNPYDAPQTVDHSTHKPWLELWLRWRENILCGAVGLGIASVDIYFREQARAKERAELVRQVMQQAQLPCPAELEPFGQP